MSRRVIFSLVLYKHTYNCIKDLFLSILELYHLLPSSYLLSVYIHDNSGQESKFDISQIPDVLKSITQLTCSSNIGFGAAHNHNYANSHSSDSDIFIICNPDISFKGVSLIPLIGYCADNNSTVSCIAPLIFNQKHMIQYSAKHNPTIASLLLSRFSFLRVIPLFSSYHDWHRHTSLDYTSNTIRAPYLSGCFLLVPSHFYRLVGGFSSRYFLHMEDADLVRRLSALGLTLHNPIGTVFHSWSRGSHKSLKQTLYLLQSAFNYFHFWGLKLW